MGFRDVGDVVIYVGAVAGALAAIGVLLRWLVVKPLKKWVTEQSRPAREAASQLKPNGGGSARDLLQATSDKLESLTSQMGDYAAIAADNHELASQALILARDTSARLDRHLTSGH